MGMGIIQNLYTLTVKYVQPLSNLLKFMYVIDNLSLLHETFLNIKILRVIVAKPKLQQLIRRFLTKSQLLTFSEKW